MVVGTWMSPQEELRRYNYVTPKNYLDFINNYKRALATNRSTIQDTVGRLSGGLEKLIQAAVEVDAMQKELSQAKVVVEQATKECNELLEVCTGMGMGRAFGLLCSCAGRSVSCCFGFRFGNCVTLA